MATTASPSAQRKAVLPNMLHCSGPETNQQALRHFQEKDARLAAFCATYGACPLAPQSGLKPYDSLGRSIIYQQLAGKAAAAIHNKVKTQLGNGAFPRPQVLLACGEEQLRAAGLSRNKALALQDLARHQRDGLIPTLAQMRRLSDEEIIERLTDIRGIGRWTVEMMLIFHLGRADVLPVDDYGVRQGFALLYRKRRLPTPLELRHFGRRWAPYRSIASWYMWRAVEVSRAQGKAAQR